MFSIAALLFLYFMNTLTLLLPQTAVVSLIVLAVVELGVAALLWGITKNLTLGIVTAAVLFVPTVILYIINSGLFVSLIPKFLSAIDLFARYGGFTYGHIDLPAVVLYLSFTVFFLFATVRLMEKRRFA